MLKAGTRGADAWPVRKPKTSSRLVPQHKAVRLPTNPTRVMPGKVSDGCPSVCPPPRLFPRSSPAACGRPGQKGLQGRCRSQPSSHPPPTCGQPVAAQEQHRRNAGKGMESTCSQRWYERTHGQRWNGKHSQSTAACIARSAPGNTAYSRWDAEQHASGSPHEPHGGGFLIRPAPAPIAVPVLAHSTVPYHPPTLCVKHASEVVNKSSGNHLLHPHPSCQGGCPNPCP